MVLKKFFLDLMIFLTHINIRHKEFLKPIFLCTTILYYEAGQMKISPFWFLSHIIVLATLVSMRVRLRIITRTRALMLVNGMASDLLG